MIWCATCLHREHTMRIKSKPTFLPNPCFCICWRIQLIGAEWKDEYTRFYHAMLLEMGYKERKRVITRFLKSNQEGKMDKPSEQPEYSQRTLASTQTQVDLWWLFWGKRPHKLERCLGHWHPLGNMAPGSLYIVVWWRDVVWSTEATHSPSSMHSPA